MKIKNGLTFVPVKDFSIRYFDRLKKSGQWDRYINAGFFGNYKDMDGNLFTLPVANLVCDCAPTDIVESAEKYLLPHYAKGKIRYNCADNATDQFKGKKVSTLIVPQTGNPYIDDVSEVPADAKYAISGVPTIRNGDDVDYYNYVAQQGWDGSCMYATYRNWIGVREGELWIITGKTTSANYIYGMEFWKKVRSENFDDVICLDGGGSYHYQNGKAKATFGNRRINSIITF